MNISPLASKPAHSPNSQYGLQTSKKENIKAALILAGMGSTTGAIFAVIQDVPMKMPAFATGLTWGVAGFLFFASRSHFDLWISPRLGSIAPYSLWYPTAISSLAGGASGLATSLLVGTHESGALRNAGSFSILAGCMQCTWILIRRFRQDLLLQEQQTGASWMQRISQNASNRFHDLVHTSESMRWLPFRFISQEEHLHRLSLQLAKTQDAMQSYEKVMEILTKRIDTLNSTPK